MAVEKPTWIYKSEGDRQTASEMNQLAQAVIVNATELSNTKDDVASLSIDVNNLDNRITTIEESGCVKPVEEDKQVILRRVDVLSDLYSISDSVLSVLKDGSDAIGQEWFVASEDCKYRLDNWENRKSLSGWTKLPKQELINTKQSISEKDQPNGYAGLDSNGKLPIEKTYGVTATITEVETYESLPAIGLSGVIYYVLNTGAQYKWSGSTYIDITDGTDNAKKNETSIFDCSNGTSTKYYSSLSDAINIVPQAYRTSNRIISYLSTENSTTSAVNYQYNGIDDTTWTDLTKWERIPNQADLSEIRSIIGNIDFDENALKNFLRKDKEDTANELITFLRGLKSLGDLDVGNFASGMLTGKGGRIDARGNAEFQSAVIRGSMKIMELLINRLYAIESDYVYTEADTVEEVEELGENTYRLTLRRKYDGYFTAQKENNVLFGVINSLGAGSGREYYTAWSRVLSVNTTDNTITVVMYPKNEVPDGVNYPPTKGMVLARKGSSDSPLDGSHNERQDFWSMSSSDGRLLFLQNVAKPILEEYYYTLSIGKLPELEKFKALPIGKDDTAVYAKNIVAENYYQIDASGNVQTQEVYRGAWSADVAAGDQPYRRIVNDVTTPTGSTSHVLAVHTVYHRGCKWACLTDMTTLEPKWNSTAWQFLEGDSNYSIRFSAYPSERVRINAVNMVITARVYYGNLDITDELLALPGTDIQWTRNSGIIPEDNAWHPALGVTKNILNITNHDMATNWLAVQRVGFVITVFIPTGDGTYYQATDELPLTI